MSRPPTRATSRSATSRWSIPGSAAANARPVVGGDENMCVVKPNSLGVYCDGGYADHMTVPNPKYLLNLKGLDPVTAAPYACSGVTTYSALKKVEFAFNSPIVIFGAGGLGLMALSLLKAMGGKGAIVVDIDARKREAAEAAGALATVDGKAPDALEQLAKTAGGPIRAVIDLVGNAADHAARLRLPDQGRQARHRRPVRRRRALGAAADSDQGDHDPGQLCRQSARNPGTARSRPHQEDRADSGNDDAARQGQRSADRSAEGQAGRPRGADAVGRLRVSLPVIARSEATKQSIFLRAVRMDCFASLAMTNSPILCSTAIRKPHVRKQRASTSPCSAATASALK